MAGIHLGRRPGSTRCCLQQGQYSTLGLSFHIRKTWSSDNGTSGIPSSLMTAESRFAWPAEMAPRGPSYKPGAFPLHYPCAVTVWVSSPASLELVASASSFPSTQVQSHTTRLSSAMTVFFRRKYSSIRTDSELHPGPCPMKEYFLEGVSHTHQTPWPLNRRCCKKHCIQFLP